MFGNNPKPVRVREQPDCKIKIKKTANGREISFSGNCSKEQIEIAKSNISDRIETEDE